MFSVIRLEGYVNFFIRKVFQVVYFTSTTVVKTENREEGFLENFFSNFALLVIGNYVPISLQIWSRKWDQVEEIERGLNYGKFICNVFSWDTVKIGIIRAKVQFSVLFKMVNCSRVSSICAGIVSLLLVKCRQGLSNCIKNPHCFVSVSFYV